MKIVLCMYFFFSSRRRHTRWPRDWSSDVCSSDLGRRFKSCHPDHSSFVSRLRSADSDWLERNTAALEMLPVPGVGAPGDGMAPDGRNLGQRAQHESVLEHVGARNHETPPADCLLPVQEQIQVEFAPHEFFRMITPRLALH